MRHWVRESMRNPTLFTLFCEVGERLTCGQVVSVLREGDGGDGADVAGEVGHVGALLQVPDLDLRVGRPRPEDQTVRVELSTGQSWRGTGQDV